MSKPLLTINNLSISFDEKPVLNKVSFQLGKGEILGIVGESGSGKSLTSLAIMGLLPKKAHVSGEIFFQGKEILSTDTTALRGSQMGMIFQEPMSSLNPSIKCGKQVLENLILHEKISLELAQKKVLDLFEEVELPQPKRIFNAYPHELSGGQKQRVMIAMALVCKPQLLIADEPTTALDVTVQKSILELLQKLQKNYAMSIVFISHDLGVIAQLCNRVLVMYRGNVVEVGDAKQVFNHPKKPYTQGLIACRPKLGVRLKRLPTVKDFTDGSPVFFEEETEKEKIIKLDSLYQKAPLLEVKNLYKYFNVGHGFLNKNKITAVNNVSFELYPGETLGLVGESGSGKTTLSRSLLMLDKPSSGEVIYEARDISSLRKKELRKLRKDIQIIFQDPYSSLNPMHSIEKILTIPMSIHGIGESNTHRKKIAMDLLEKVGLKAEDLKKYPHEFSGGQRQRIGIARAISLKPKLIVCDESVSALDVSVQAQVLNLLNDLKQEFKLTYLFISHDLSVVKYMSDRLIVLKNGEMQEYGLADEIYKNPKTDYTRDLIHAIPKL